MVQCILDEEPNKGFPAFIAFGDSHVEVPGSRILPVPLKIVLHAIGVYDGIDFRIDRLYPLQNLFVDYGSEFCGIFKVLFAWCGFILAHMAQI